ncbi:MAG TPA: hypothetical protein VFF06_21040 [Polyangia bacterium]|nr:hypothetical protein [Polyangia bacterium]
MKLDAITLMLPDDPGRAARFAYGELIEQLRARFRGVVTALPAAQPAPASGALLVDGPSGVDPNGSALPAFLARWDAAARRRAIALNVPRGRETVGMIETHGLAGAVDEHDFWQWMSADPPKYDGVYYAPGLIGRRDLLAQLGCPIDTPGPAGVFARCDGAAYQSLANLLLAYLEAWCGALG